jgi:hypothetical protein
LLSCARLRRNAGTTSARSEGDAGRSGLMGSPASTRRRKAFGKKCRLHEELIAGSDTKDQSPTIKSPAFQPQSARFNEINCGDFIALSEKHLVSGETTSRRNRGRTPARSQ